MRRIRHAARRRRHGHGRSARAGRPPRRILFVAGAPVASDATDPVAYTREGDLVVVKIGADERYEIRDALLQGG